VIANDQGNAHDAGVKESRKDQETTKEKQIEKRISHVSTHTESSIGIQSYLMESNPFQFNSIHDIKLDFKLTDSSHESNPA
jgi:hypothetical protein